MAGAEALEFTVEGAGWNSSCKITLLYRQPASALGGFLESLEHHFHNSGITPHIILGDFNIDIGSPSQSINQQYISLISSYNLTNIITVPTRISTCKTSILDHVLINFKPNSVSSGTVYSDVSDHLPTFALINLLPPSDHSAKPSNSTHRLLNKCKITSVVEKIDWEPLYRMGDAEKMTAYLLQTLQVAIDRGTEIKTLGPKTSKQDMYACKPWITSYLKLKI